jgi:hypothetical protein
VVISKYFLAAPILSNLSQQGYQQLQQFAEKVTIPSLITQMGIARMQQHFTHEIISHHYVDRARNGDAEALLSQIILVRLNTFFPYLHLSSLRLLPAI